MEIKVVENGGKELDEFYRREWAVVDKKHYGREIPWESWTPKSYTIEAYQDKEIVGALSFTIHQDVSVIELFIIAEKRRGEGIGKLLITKLEAISKENSVHKIYLQTGKDWEEVNFYKKFGYEKTGDLPNHYLHSDYIEMTKFI